MVKRSCYIMCIFIITLTTKRFFFLIHRPSTFLPTTAKVGIKHQSINLPTIFDRCNGHQNTESPLSEGFRLIESCFQLRFLCIYYYFFLHKIQTTIYGNETTVCGRCVKKNCFFCESEK